VAMPEPRSTSTSLPSAGFFKKVEDEARRVGGTALFPARGEYRIFRFIEAEDAGHEFVQLS